MKKLRLLWITLLFITGAVHAADLAEMKAKLEEMMPFNVESIEAVGNSGLYEVVVNGGEIIYFTEDLSYGIEGVVIVMDTGENITASKKKILRKGILSSLDESKLIVYKPKKTEYVLTVFTDIDCGYCRLMHKQMSAYNAEGIEIRYMAYPRGGLESESFDKAEAVWCADDRKQAMSAAKEGQVVTSKQCDSPVKAQFELGQSLGVTGTPTLFMSDGTVLPGYAPPKQLRQKLDEITAAGS